MMTIATFWNLQEMTNVSFTTRIGDIAHAIYN